MNLKNKSLSLIVILSAPSGGGKTTLCSKLRGAFPEMVYSVSYTTRSPRASEKNGKDYFFVSEQEFKEKIKRGEFIEWAKVHGYFYGTSKIFFEQALSENKDIILEIDIKGGLTIKKKFNHAVGIFIVPSTLSELKRRLIFRKEDSKQMINKRLNIALIEIKKAQYYDYLVLNDNLNKAFDELKAIVIAEKRKIIRMSEVMNNLLKKGV